MSLMGVLKTIGLASPAVVALIGDRLERNTPPPKKLAEGGVTVARQVDGPSESTHDGVLASGEDMWDLQHWADSATAADAIGAAWDAALFASSFTTVTAGSESYYIGFVERTGAHDGWQADLKKHVKIMTYTLRWRRVT